MVVSSHRQVPVVICSGPKGGAIARCDTGKPKAENEANARLLAAAYTSYDCHFGPLAVEAAEGTRSGRLSA